MQYIWINYLKIFSPVLQEVGVVINDSSQSQNLFNEILQLSL